MDLYTLFAVNGQNMQYFTLRLDVDAVELTPAIVAENIYLYGGWDGNTDLADLWSYHVPTGEWTCIAKNTDEDVSTFCGGSIMQVLRGVLSTNENN